MFLFPPLSSHVFELTFKPRLFPRTFSFWPLCGTLLTGVMNDHLNLIRDCAAITQHLCHTPLFSLQKKPIVSHKPMRMGVQPKLKHSNKILSYGDCKSSSRYKNSYTSGKSCTHSFFFFRSLVPKDKFIVAWPVSYTHLTLPTTASV